MIRRMVRVLAEQALAQASFRFSKADASAAAGK
jgi:hypothetical protein